MDDEAVWRIIEQDLPTRPAEISVLLASPDEPA
jgi:hypothetical protein